MTAARRVASNVAPPLAFGVLFLLAWQALVRWRDIESFVLPAPTDIWSAFTRNFSRILEAAERSGTNALVGLVLGGAVAVLAAALATRIRVVDELVTPLVAALAAMPIVALAPLLNNMYSSTSAMPRRIVVAVAAFVPIFTNVARGLKRLRPVHAELMASYAASGTDVLRTIRIPTALPYFFTGLRIAASLAVIASVVTEYFGGLKDGLGSRITSSVSATDYPAAWASVLGAVLLGLLFYVVALGLERVAMRGRADVTG
ncbi:ABC transporter permease [Jatrophihabitans fulvus]